MKLTEEQLKSLSEKAKRCPNCNSIGSTVPQGDALRMVHSIEGDKINYVEFGITVCDRCAYTSTYLLKLL